MTAIPRRHVSRLARYLLGSGALLLWVPNSMAQKPTRGAAAPEIDLPTLTGGRVKLSSLKGHPVVVTFWGTWCPPCRAELPSLLQLGRELSDAGKLLLVAVSLDTEWKDVKGLTLKEIQTAAVEQTG